MPADIRAEENLLPFTKKLKSFFFIRLSNVFDPDDIRSFKLVCVKCRRPNPFNTCKCYKCVCFFLLSLFCSTGVRVSGLGLLLLLGHRIG